MVQKNHPSPIFDQVSSESLLWIILISLPQLGAEDKVRVKTLYAKRGRIKDAQGNALAVQGKIYSVGFVPGKMDGNSVKLAAYKVFTLTLSSAPNCGKITESSQSMRYL